MVMPLMEPPPEPRPEMGPLCRCLQCCCAPHEGHRSLEYREWLAAMERWEESRGRGSGATPGGD